MTRRAAIIGGGITGLAAAHRLRELDPNIDITVFEAASRLGGVLCSERTDGFLIEHSADNFITDQPWGLDLCRRIGLAEHLQSTNEVGRRAFVVLARSEVTKQSSRRRPDPDCFVRNDESFPREFRRSLFQKGRHAFPEILCRTSDALRAEFEV